MKIKVKVSCPQCRGTLKNVDLSEPRAIIGYCPEDKAWFLVDSTSSNSKEEQRRSQSG